MYFQPVGCDQCLGTCLTVYLLTETFIERVKVVSRLVDVLEIAFLELSKTLQSQLLPFDSSKDKDT